MKIGHVIIVVAVLVAAFLVWRNRSALKSLISK